MRQKSLLFLVIAVITGTFFGCGGGSNINFVGKNSTKTGLKYNEEGGFQVPGRVPETPQQLNCFVFDSLYRFIYMG